MLALSLAAGVVGLIVAIPLSRLAGRVGWAGWGTAMLVAGIPSAAVAPAFDAPPGVAVPCAILGFLYWLGVRVSRPAS